MGRKKAYKIFDIEYLINDPLSEDDLYYLFETPSLSYSLLINMFRRTKQSLNDEKKIISLAKNDKDWMYKYFWSDKDRENFERDLIKVYKNIYRCGDAEAESRSQWWIFMYGLTNEKLKDNKNISKLCDD